MFSVTAMTATATAMTSNNNNDSNRDSDQAPSMAASSGRSIVPIDGDTKAQEQPQIPSKRKCGSLSMDLIEQAAKAMNGDKSLFVNTGVANPENQAEKDEELEEDGAPDMEVPPAPGQ
eukprot:59438-Lingulodinium_polyedra.AAC.1